MTNLYLSLLPRSRLPSPEEVSPVPPSLALQPLGERPRAALSRQHHPHRLPHSPHPLPPLRDLRAEAAARLSTQLHLREAPRVEEIRLIIGVVLCKSDVSFLRFSSSGRRSLSSDQLDLYSTLESLLTNTFALDGRQCVQRLVCDLAHNPVRDKSLMGEVMHALLE